MHRKFLQIKSSVALGAEVEHLKQLKIGMTVFHDKFGLGENRRND